MTDVSLIGLGDMGAAIGRVLLDRGHKVTVWNRTAAKTDDLAARGAERASSAEAALRASPVVITCISTHEDTGALLSAAPDAVRGRRVIELSTGDGPAAAALEAQLRDLGAPCVMGMILAGPGQIGETETAFLIAGDIPTWEETEALIRDLAPASNFIGADVAHLADLFSALFLPRQGAMFGMIYGAHFCEVAGVPLEVYVKQLPAAMRVATSLYAKTVADTIPTGDFSGSGSPLKIYEQAFRDGFASFAERGANTELSDLFEDLIARGMKAGYGEEHLTALIKVLRSG